MRIGVLPCFLSFFVLAATTGQGLAYEENPSLERILPQIRERHPGKFYDAEGPYRGSDGQWRYRLKWMTPDGRIVWFDADARTGRVLGPDFDARGPRREQEQHREQERMQQQRHEQQERNNFRDERRFERERPFPRQDRPRRRR
jgi:hypothetical protein